MENLLSLFSPETLPIDFVMIVLVLFGGFFQKKYLTDVKASAAMKTLIVGTLFCSLYILLKIMNGAVKPDEPVRWLFSYVFATSMYELLMKKFVNKYFPEDKLQDHE